MNKQRVTWSAILGTVAASVAIWTALSPWHMIGWITPDQHSASITEIKREYRLTAGEVSDFRDEWKCDEYYEELLDLKREKRKAELEDEDTVEIEDEIERLKDKIEKVDCSRFEDFG